jgi:hypothetical protein
LLLLLSGCTRDNAAQPGGRTADNTAPTSGTNRDSAADADARDGEAGSSAGDSGLPETTDSSVNDSGRMPQPSSADAGDASSPAVDAGLPDASDSAINPIVRQECPASIDPNPCYSCEENHCCDSYAQYASNPEAKALKNCVIECWDTLGGGAQNSGETCEERCSTSHPTGAADWAPRSACLSIFCEGPDACGEMLQSACVQCLNTFCKSERADQLGTAEGYLFTACTAGCGRDNAPCFLDCRSRYPEAGGASDMLGECMIAHCAECLANQR